MAAHRELQPEQAAAVYEIDKHLSLTAGPGSGKTTVLVERYLHILRERRLSIDQIVAITFTNRAANEMRERLRTRLNEFLQTAKDPERPRWLDYKRTLDGAVITTIHGFCARLIREFPVEAEIDPQFVLLDEHRAAMLLETVVEETLSEFISSGHDEISRLTLGVGRGKLAAALAQLYRDARGQGLSFSDLALKTGANHATEEDYSRAVSESQLAMHDFLAVPRTTVKQVAHKMEVQSSWQMLRPLIQEIPSPEQIADYCRAVEAFSKLRPSARDTLKGFVNDLDELLWKKNLKGRVPQVCLDSFARTYALEMVNVLSRVDERLTQEKQRLAALDFDDLELRALALLQRPEVRTRAIERYKFFLVDEFQDTNSLQQQLLEQLALSSERRESARLFIVGDRKQSVYGFRGADVGVFREMTETLLAHQGETRSLPLNFRSQPPLIDFFNCLFQQLFIPGEETPAEQLDELGYVSHEPSLAKRELTDEGPLVELMITTTEDPGMEQTSRELDAEQLARRITDLTKQNENLRFSDIALLFRAMTHVSSYESAFRRANIPYETVLGRGFYERQEVTDLIQLLRFLDNKTDELALAAVLRSPLCGISDNALLALRCGPLLVDREPLRRFSQTRRLISGLRRHREIASISEEEHKLLERANLLIQRLIARQHHYNIGDLLRFATETSEYLTVIAATFDGPQRLANVQRLFTLAERFEASGTHLIRDFVRYVKEFEAIGSRESEGQIDEGSNAVRLMTIHQAKGLEFPVVIIPDLHRSSKVLDNWVLLDRHQGLTLKVPDGRGKLVAGQTFNSFARRQSWREQFESMRLLYVAATRAQDRLILSGVTTELDKLRGRPDTWLKWIWQSLELENQRESGVVHLTNNAQLQITLNFPVQDVRGFASVEQEDTELLEAGSLESAFPLIRAVDGNPDRAINRFSVTHLTNYQRCPRQYYFDRVLHLPSEDKLVVWNDAEAPEPPANLTAALKGAVIHRFCETFQFGDDPGLGVRASLDEIIRRRQAELADRLAEIDRDAAVSELLPLAENYISSDLFRRVEAARQETNGTAGPLERSGLWSELNFRLRRPLGILTGTIDKLLITSSIEGSLVEIIDFKTNRIWSSGSRAPRLTAAASANTSGYLKPSQQIPLDFMTVHPSDEPMSVADSVAIVARDYRLQMQAYALAARTLLPFLDISRLKVTLHFLEPNIEFNLSDELLSLETCEAAIDEAMHQLATSLAPEHFPTRPAHHCRMCSFLSVCDAGLRFVNGES